MQSLTYPLVFLSLLFTFAMPSQAGKYKGVSIDSSVTMNGTTLELNGYGVREKWFFDLYVGKLYLTEKSHDAAAIIHSEQPQLIVLNIISNKITNKKMRDAVNDGFRNATNGNTQPIQNEINRFMKAFDGKIKKGNEFKFYWDAASMKTLVFKNGKQIETIDGMAFKQALFSIWLGDKPADKGLKKGLLGH